MSETDEDRIARLRDATAGVMPSAAFVDGVIGSAKALRPRSLRRTWWTVPIAAAVAAAALIWAVSVRERRRADAEAARDIEIALGAEHSSW